LNNTFGEEPATWKKSELSERAKQQIAGLQATSERLVGKGLELDTRTTELEALAPLKENMLRRYQKYLARIQAELQAI